MSITTVPSHLATFTADGSGAIKRDLKDKLSDVISVKDFGAVGDGVTDDTNAFSKAIQVFGSNLTGNIIVPSGNYLVTLASLPSIGSGLIVWHGDNAKINGSKDPDGLPGKFITLSGGMVSSFFIDNEDTGSSFAFGEVKNYVRKPGGAGNREAEFIRNTVAIYGNAGEMIVGIHPEAHTNSSGSVFGSNPYAHVGPLAAASAEAVGEEINVKVEAASFLCLVASLQRIADGADSVSVCVSN